ncbi:hypothetical protein [Microbispora rosea]|uniref:hypothetical protein n=1 Tax=Microbispora rosea TaxID=58117 RepID=UPI0004C2B65D|nr:hypothetical protein [Microbispora rosea]
MKFTRCAVVVSAALCLLAVAACGGMPRAGTPAAIPATADSTPADSIVVDKDQALTCGEGEGSAQALCDAIAAAASRASARSSPKSSVEQDFKAEVLKKKGQPSSLPNPGSGPGDPLLRQALLVNFEGAGEPITRPGVVVALPAAEGRAVEFISPPRAAELFHASSVCTRWNEGSWRVVLRDFNRHGVQIAATRLRATVDEAWERSAEFSETIVTGPAPMLSTLGDPAAMASCRKFSSAFGRSMSVRPIPVPPLGTRSWAFRVMEGKSVTQWVEVVRTPRYVLEVRIPNQWPRPRTDPAVLLPRIAEAAYARAEAALT